MHNDVGVGNFDEATSKRARVEEEEEVEEARMENIIVHTIRTDNENCTHEVAIPPNAEFAELRENSGTEPAKYYPFQLDAFQVSSTFNIIVRDFLFQKQAILCIDNNQSVLVSAHTSAGKTVVATFVQPFRKNCNLLLILPDMLSLSVSEKSNVSSTRLQSKHCQTKNIENWKKNSKMSD